MHAICRALAVVAWLAALSSGGCGHNVHVRLNNGRGTVHVDHGASDSARQAARQDGARRAGRHR